MSECDNIQDMIFTKLFDDLPSQEACVDYPE